MAGAYQASGGIDYKLIDIGDTAHTVTIPAHAAGDIYLLQSVVREAGVGAFTPETTGITWTGIAYEIVRGTSSTYFWYWARSVGGAEATVVITYGNPAGPVDAYALVTSYRGCLATGDPFGAKGTPATGTADPAVYTGVTTAVANELVVVSLTGEDNNNASVIITSTSPADYTELYDESASGTDGMVCIGYANRTAAGATGNASVNFNVAVPVGWGGIVVSLQPALVVVHNLLLMGVGV